MSSDSTCPSPSVNSQDSSKNTPSDGSLSAARNIVSIPRSNSYDGALSQIEDLLESIVDALDTGSELVIPFRRSRPDSVSQTQDLSQQRDARQSEVVRFPGRTIQEAKKFEALFRIIELSHEALLAGNVITKRNIYYQHPDLFKSQSVVDVLVDNLAFTLGVGRRDLNIVAAAKGLIAGPFELVMRDRSIQNCAQPGEVGILLPCIEAIDKIAFKSVRWILVIEKEATFRTLAASQYTKESQAGHGILITAKGFPDLATRKFLAILRSVRPGLPLFGLVDFDPHGIAILRTYQYGSKRLDHELDATTPDLKWIGIRSHDIMSHKPLNADVNLSNDSKSSQEWSSQESQPNICDARSQIERPTKRLRVHKLQDSSELCAPLTPNDRKKAVEILRDIISSTEHIVEHELQQIFELQRMLMLNIKAEIQAVDNYGDLTTWLNEKLCHECS